MGSWGGRKKTNNWKQNPLKDATEYTRAKQLFQNIYIFGCEG
jgi:hypothetical protein